MQNIRFSKLFFQKRKIDGSVLMKFPDWGFLLCCGIFPLLFRVNWFETGNRGIKTPGSSLAAQLAVAPGKTWPTVAAVLSWQWQQRQGTFCSEVLVGNVDRPGPLVRSHQPSDAASWEPSPIHNENQSFLWWAESEFMKLEVGQSWGCSALNPVEMEGAPGPPAGTVGNCLTVFPNISRYEGALSTGRSPRAVPHLFL